MCEDKTKRPCSYMLKHCFFMYTQDYRTKPVESSKEVTRLSILEGKGTYEDCLKYVFNNMRVKAGYKDGPCTFFKGSLVYFVYEDKTSNKGDMMNVEYKDFLVAKAMVKRENVEELEYYKDFTLVQARTREEAVEKYNRMNECKFFYGRVVGVIELNQITLTEDVLKSMLNAEPFGKWS